MRHPSASVFVIAVLALVTSCDQQQPIATKPSLPPGEKPGETPPPKPQRQPTERETGSAPLPPATAPATPGIQNHPAAPEVPLPPPPASSPTTAPPSIPPPANDDQKPAVTPTSGDGTATIRAPAGAGRSDQGITTAVYRALTAQPGLSLDGALITVNTQDGNVILHGSVRSEVEREHVVALVALVSGVRSVDDQLDHDGP